MHAVKWHTITVTVEEYSQQVQQQEQDVFSTLASCAVRRNDVDVLCCRLLPASQPVFLAESSQLLQQAQQEMQALSEVVTSAQVRDTRTAPS